jgi:hypothetical protein
MDQPRGFRIDPDLAPGAEKQRPPIVAKPFVWKDPRTLPRRNPILGKFWPGFLSATVGAGAIGKSSRIVVDALEIASGHSLFHPSRPPQNVWLWNLEDPLIEMEKRIEAAMLHYRIKPEETQGRLFLNGRDTPLKLAHMAYGSIRIDPTAVDEMIDMIRTFQIAVLFLDPLRNAHRITENDNTQLGVVCDMLIDIANATSCAIDIAHHPRKAANGTEEITIDDARGGGALGGALRAARIVRRMTPEEAQLANIEEAKRIFYFCVNDNAKPNLGIGREAEWCRLISQPLGNDGDSGERGDDVQVATPWKMPGALDGLSVTHLDELHRAMGDDLFPTSPRASDWIGYTLARVAGIDAETEGGKKRLKIIIANYVAADQLILVQRKNPKHPGMQDCYRRP